MNTIMESDLLAISGGNFANDAGYFIGATASWLCAAGGAHAACRPVRREGGDANLILNGKEGARSASFGRLLPTLVMKIGLPGFLGRRRGLLGS